MNTQDKHRETLSAIQDNETYKQVLKDSFGGVLYMEGTQSNYNSEELLSMWDTLPDSYKEASGGITKGVFNFLKS